MASLFWGLWKLAGIFCSSVHGIFQARVLEWGAIAFSGSIYIRPKINKKSWETPERGNTKTKHLVWCWNTSLGPRWGCSCLGCRGSKLKLHDSCVSGHVLLDQKHCISSQSIPKGQASSGLYAYYLAPSCPKQDRLRCPDSQKFSICLHLVLRSFLEKLLAFCSFPNGDCCFMKC